MVMHIRIPPAPKPKPESPRHRPPDDPNYNPIHDRRVSLPIKLWVLLHRGDWSLADIEYYYGFSPKSMAGAVVQLRRRGCEIPPRRRKLHLSNPEYPLLAMNTSRGVMLGSDAPHLAAQGFRVTCSPGGDDWGLRTHGAPSSPRVTGRVAAC